MIRDVHCKSWEDYKSSVSWSCQLCEHAASMAPQPPSTGTWLAAVIYHPTTGAAPVKGTPPNAARLLPQFEFTSTVPSWSQQAPTRARALSFASCLIVLIPNASSERALLHFLSFLSFFLRLPTKRPQPHRACVTRPQLPPKFMQRDDTTDWNSEANTSLERYHSRYPGSEWSLTLRMSHLF